MHGIEAEFGAWTSGPYLAADQIESLARAAGSVSSKAEFSALIQRIRSQLAEFRRGRGISRFEELYAEEDDDSDIAGLRDLPDESLISGMTQTGFLAERAHDEWHGVDQL